MKRTGQATSSFFFREKNYEQPGSDSFQKWWMKFSFQFCAYKQGSVVTLVFLRSTTVVLVNNSLYFRNAFFKSLLNRAGFLSGPFHSNDFSI